MIDWRKAGMIAFLLMIVIGFSVPSFLDYGPGKQVQIRYCQADSGCYLTCDGKPVAALCYQNLCQRNSCEEQGIEYMAEPTSFGLTLSKANQSINASLVPGNVFVSYNDKVLVFAKDLPLAYVLDKFNLPAQQFSLDVNGEPNYQFENYVPQQADSIRINYE